MPFFSISKVDKYRQNQEQDRDDIIDIKFPSELKNSKKEALEKLSPSSNKEILIFVVDDDPVFMQILNTHFDKLTLPSQTGNNFKFKVRNYATGRSCITDLNFKPDLIFLNYFINKGMPNAITGKDTLNSIININPNQRVLILDELTVNLRGAFVENGLRDYIISDHSALEELNKSIIEILEGER